MPPAPIKLPPPRTKKGQSQQAVYRQYINAHPALRRWAQAIYRNALNYGLDPTFFAALILFESGGRADAVSSAGAVGLGQIHRGTWLGKADPRTGKIITEADIRNPSWNLGFAAWYFKQNLDRHGNYDAAYRKGYNPGYTGGGPFADMPRGYVPTTTAKSPQEAAQRSVETEVAKQAITDPWVVIDKKGRVKLVYSFQPPANAVRYGGKNGPAVTQSQFFQLWKNRLDPIFLSYTNKRATAAQAATILRKGVSDYQLQTQLAKTPAFFNSPIWKQYAPGYKSIFRKIFGEDAYSPEEHRAFVAYAITHNLDGEGFATYLRQQPAYLKSMEFKQGVTGFTQIYSQIYGAPTDNAALTTIQEAVRAGWAPEQFASYLRQQDAYKFSPEYQGKALSFLERLGLIFGGQPTLKPGGAPRPATVTGEPPPDSSLVPGTPGPLTAPSGLQVTA